MSTFGVDEGHSGGLARSGAPGAGGGNKMGELGEAALERHPRWVISERAALERRPKRGFGKAALECRLPPSAQSLTGAKCEFGAFDSSSSHFRILSDVKCEFGDRPDERDRTCARIANVSHNSFKTSRRVRSYARPRATWRPAASRRALPGVPPHRSVRTAHRTAHGSDRTAHRTPQRPRPLPQRPRLVALLDRRHAPPAVSPPEPHETVPHGPGVQVEVGREERGVPP